MQNAITGRLMVVCDVLLAALSFIESVDISIRILSGVAAVVLAVFGAIHYHGKIMLNRLDRQIKEQELYDIIETNKKKHG
jgi:hypothetical protein